MEKHCQDDQWHVDRRQIVGEPTREVDVGNRAALYSERFS